MKTKNPMQLKAFIKKEVSRKKHFSTVGYAKLYDGKDPGENFRFRIQK